MSKKKVPPKKVVPFVKKKRKAGGVPFKKGRAKTGGRQKGTPNKVPVEVREFMRRMIDDPDIQAAMKAKMLIGDGQLFMKMVEQTLGKPKEEVNVTSPDMARLLTLAFEHRRGE